MPQDRTRKRHISADTTYGQDGYIGGPPAEAFAPVQSKTPSMMHQERIRANAARDMRRSSKESISRASAANTMGKMGPMSPSASPPPGPVSSSNPLMNTGTPFTPGMRPQASPAIDPDIRTRNRNPNPNMPGIIVPKPDL